MKHWEEESSEDISLKDANFNRVVSLCKVGDMIEFTEECDNWFSVKLTKEDAKAALLEAIEWIEGMK